MPDLRDIDLSTLSNRAANALRKWLDQGDQGLIRYYDIQGYGDVFRIPGIGRQTAPEIGAALGLAMDEEICRSIRINFKVSSPTKEEPAK